MADKIRLLPEIVANQIAAGEVVCRPASVVKEMMENAIDAGARRVKVNYRDGGKELIQIVDDGCGMSPIDARMAFDRHATSKIRSVDDIYRLSTFGFRGEALASIAAVAQVELRTRQQDDEMGTVTEINGGQFASQQPIMCPVGSQFFVRNLFYNVPARRRFLEKSTTSSNQIKAEFQRVALCNPDIAFELYANDAPLHTFAPTTLAGRIVDVVGRYIKQNLLEVGAESSIANIHGFIGRPMAAKRRNADQYLFVNGRYFKSQYLTGAILKAYEKLIPEGAQPAYFLYLTLDPERVDVNVHPQKTEVKFAEEAAVWQIVNAAVRETLAKTGVIPMMDFDRDQTVEIPVMRQGVVYREPQAASEKDYNPFADNYIDPTAPDPNEDFTGFDIPYDDRSQMADGAPAPYLTPQSRPSSRQALRPVPGFVPDGSFTIAGGKSQPREEFDDFVSGGGVVEEWDDVPSTLKFVDESDIPVEQRLNVDDTPQFGDVMVLGRDSLVALLDSRLMVVDVRRARERIFFDHYVGKLRGGQAVGQQLLFPERLLLSEEEYALLEEHAVDVAALGFDLDFCGCGALEVRAIPALLTAESVDRVLYDLLRTLELPVSAAEERCEKIAAVMAVTAAKVARNSQALFGRDEAASLLKELAASSNMSFSPLGKSIMAEVDMDELRAKLN